MYLKPALFGLMVHLLQHRTYHSSGRFKDCKTDFNY